MGVGGWGSGVGVKKAVRERPGELLGGIDGVGELVGAVDHAHAPGAALFGGLDDQRPAQAV